MTKKNKCGDCIHCLIYDKDPYICEYHRPKRKQKIAIANSTPFLLSGISGLAAAVALFSSGLTITVPLVLLSTLIFCFQKEISMGIKRKYFFKQEYEILANKKMIRLAEKERQQAAKFEIETFESQLPQTREKIALNSAHSTEKFVRSAQKVRLSSHKIRSLTKRKK